MSSIIKIIFGITTLVAILAGAPGCAVGPDFKAPVVKTPDDYHSETAPVDKVNLKWWRLFDDPILFEIVHTALLYNRDVKIAAARIEQARAALGFTRADMWPKLGLQGGATVGNSQVGQKTGSTDYNLYIAPTLSWELDFWGKFRRANESAKADMMATEFAARTVQLGLISEVVITYYTLLDYHQRLAVSRETVESRSQSLEIIQQRFNYGTVPEIDLNQAQIQYEIAAAAIPEFERLIAKTEYALSLLVGKLPRAFTTGVPLENQPLPPEVPVGIPSAVLERRPDLAESLFQLQAQNARIGVATAMLFPSISINGLAGGATGSLSGGFIWSTGASLLGPLFEFKKNIRRIEVEKAKTKEALYRYENTVLTAFKEVEDALVEIRTYKVQAQSIQNKRDAAKNANELSKERYDKGVTSFLEVLDTERTLFNVELELAGLKREIFNSYVRLYKALGGGWLTKEEAAVAEETAVYDQ
jgi:multidrug efflux system outer membrane protein